MLQKTLSGKYNRDKAKCHVLFRKGIYYISKRVNNPGSYSPYLQSYLKFGGLFTI